jgi:surfeit locus 1 family protein
MKRIPLIPTLIVIAAMAFMISLGFWQIRRAEWKEGLLAQYAAAAGKPPIAYPLVPSKKDAPMFRQATGFCLSVQSWRSVSGRNVKDVPGWAHIAHCATGGGEGPGMQVDMGWSNAPADPVWKGGEVSGIIAPDRTAIIRLVATTPAPGLSASKPPDIADIPNNHRGYAAQWFIFAALAGIIYALALRRRQKA